LPTPADFKPNTKNLQNRYEGADLLPSQQRWTMFGTGQQKLGDKVTLFVDGLFGQRDSFRVGGGQPANLSVPTTNPHYVNPTGVPGPVTVAYNFLDELGPLQTDARVRTKDVATILEWKPGADWNVTGTVGFASEEIDATFNNRLDQRALAIALNDTDPATALNPFGGPPNNPATLASLRTKGIFKSHSRVKSANLALSGPVVTLPGGGVVLSVGAEQREQTFDLLLRDTETSVPSNRERSRSISAAYTELRVPLVGEANRVRGAHSAEISIAERYERYSDFGDTATGRLGIAWEPLSGLTLRGTYSESFRPPGLADLDESTNAFQYVALPDASAPGGAAMTLLWAGKNRDLNEERAHSWTGGLELAPERLGGVALAMTYFDIEFRDRLNQPGLSADLLSNPSLAALVTRSPTDAYRANVCSRAPQAASTSSCLDLPIAAIVDLRIRNDAVVSTSGVDLLARYTRETSWGRFSFGLNGTYILDFSEAKSSVLPLVDKVSTPTYPVDFRFRSTTRWQRGGFDVSGYVNYLNSYLDTTSNPHRHVSSWTTVDLHASYRLGASAPSALSDTTFSLGIDNMFDARPPFLNNPVGIGYDQENGDLTGRVVSLNIRKKW
jgi:outer membrane receptor protein involved in Fe transport